MQTLDVMSRNLHFAALSYYKLNKKSASIILYAGEGHIDVGRNPTHNLGVEQEWSETLNYEPHSISSDVQEQQGMIFEKFKSPTYGLRQG